MVDKRATGIAGRALFNECVGGTDESGDDICVMIGGEGDKLARVALDALESAGYTLTAPAGEEADG